MSRAFNTTDTAIENDGSHNARQSDTPSWLPVRSNHFPLPYIYNNELESQETLAANSSFSSSRLSFHHMLPTDSDNRRYQHSFNDSLTQAPQRYLGPTRSRLFQALTSTNSSSDINPTFSNTRNVSIDILRSREDEESELALLSYHQYEWPSNVNYNNIDNIRLPSVHMQFGTSNNAQQNQPRSYNSNNTPLNFQYISSRPSYSNRPLNSNSTTSSSFLGQTGTSLHNYESDISTISSPRSATHRNNSPYLSYNSFYGYPSSFLSDLPNNNFLDDYEYQLHRLEQASHSFEEPLVPSQTVSNLHETITSNNTTYTPRINVNRGSVVLPPIFMPYRSPPSCLRKKEYYMIKSSEQQMANNSVSWIRNGIKFEGETYSLRNLFRQDPAILSNCPHCKIELKICNVDLENNRVSVILKDCGSDSGPRSTQLWEGVIIEGPTCAINEKSPTTEIYNVTKHWQQLHPIHSLSNNHNHIIKNDIYSMRKAHRRLLPSQSTICQQLPSISYCESGNDVHRADRILTKAQTEYVWLLLTKVDTSHLFPVAHRSYDHSSRWQSNSVWARKKVQMLVSIRRSDGFMEGCLGTNRVDMKLLYAQPDRFSQQGMIADIRLR